MIPTTHPNPTLKVARSAMRPCLTTWGPKRRRGRPRESETGTKASLPQGAGEERRSYLIKSQGENYVPLCLDTRLYMNRQITEVIYIISRRAQGHLGSPQETEFSSHPRQESNAGPRSHEGSVCSTATSSNPRGCAAQAALHSRSAAANSSAGGMNGSDSVVV